jgi:hypothetical protein
VARPVSTEIFVRNDTFAGVAGNQADAGPGEGTSGNARITDAYAEAAWEVSSRCGGNGSCVEVARVRGGTVAVRDGKLGPAGPVLEFSEQEWNEFLSGVRAGEFG